MSVIRETHPLKQRNEVLSLRKQIINDTTVKTSPCHILKEERRMDGWIHNDITMLRFEWEGRSTWAQKDCRGSGHDLFEFSVTEPACSKWQMRRKCFDVPTEFFAGVLPNTSRNCYRWADLLRRSQRNNKFHWAEFFLRNKQSLN
jgi:hypothetical protein